MRFDTQHSLRLDRAIIGLEASATPLQYALRRVVKWWLERTLPPFVNDRQSHA